MKKANSILDVWQGSEYSSASLLNLLYKEYKWTKFDILKGDTDLKSHEPHI